jgi:hypothetical protein
MTSTTSKLSAGWPSMTMFLTSRSAFPDPRALT